MTKADEGYQIGTVAQLTGLDPHTIRAWERRYAVVKPRRSASGTRLYDEAAIERLQLLKALVDCGEKIRHVATLGEDELRSRLEKLAGLAAPAAEAFEGVAVSQPRIGLLAPAIGAQLRAAGGGLAGFEIAVEQQRSEAFLTALQGSACDVLVLDFDQLGPEPALMLRACLGASGAKVAIVVYTFARRRQLERLSRAGARLLRGPLRIDALRRAALDLLVMDEARRRHAIQVPVVDEAGAVEAPPARRFDDGQLARLAELASGVDCECPNHLSALVSSLLAFESYSHGCESRDDADAELHERLALGAGHARAALERLLAEVCEHEGIEV